MSIFDSQKNPFWFKKVEPSEVGSIQHFRELTAGAGNDIFKVNASGMFMGDTTWGSAPFRVNFDGDLRTNSISINGNDVSDSFSGANFIKDVINARIDTATKKVLSDFNFGNTDYAGAVRSGDITWNTTTGAITGGSGVVVYRKGIIGAKAGSTTFSIDATTGDATFSGDITGSTLTGGTITGATIQTATTGYRVKLTSASNIQFLNGATEKGSIGADTGDSIVYVSDDNHIFRNDTVELAKINSGGIHLPSSKTISFSGGVSITDEGSNLDISESLEVHGTIYSNSDDVDDLGKSTKEWRHLYLGGTIQGSGSINIDGNIKTGGTFESSDGSDGITETKGFVTAVESSRAKWRDIVVKDGLIVDFGSETGWL